MKRNLRKPGEIKKDEVDDFQRRWGLQVDEDQQKPVTFGNQCMGQVHLLEDELARLVVENVKWRWQLLLAAGAGMVLGGFAVGAGM